MSKENEFVEGSGNVFADIGRPDADELLIRAKILAEINYTLDERKLVQKEAAKLLRLDQADVSRLRNGKLSEFSLQRLIELLAALNKNVRIVIEDANRPGSITVESVSTEL